MVSRRVRFNIIFCLSLLAFTLSGCKSSKKSADKQVATLRVYMETSPAMGRGETVSICRSSPMLVYAERTPFLYEAHIESASIVTNTGGFSLHIELKREGSWLLEQYTSANPQKRLAIRVQFGKDSIHDRWLGAPLPSKPIRNGILTFTPDASWEETDQIVRGINAAVKQANK